MMHSKSEYVVHVFYSLPPTEIGINFKILKLKEFKFVPIPVGRREYKDKSALDPE
jgi:hypothetical protein